MARYHGERVQIVRTSGTLVCVMFSDAMTEWVDASEVR